MDGLAPSIASALSPASVEAARLASLFWWMAGGATLIWLGVIVLAIYCGRGRGDAAAAYIERRNQLLIVGGGVVFPTVVLAVLLGYGLAILPPLVARAPDARLQVAVTGEQWWWRVRYQLPDREPIELANEIRLPVGERVQFHLASDNVIHSFWIPSLAGKVDMIPGRITFLSMEPAVPGVYHGVCAEYCGTSHALMHFRVPVMERGAFERWVEQQATPALDVRDPLAIRGEGLFLANGCSACHTVRGTPARGTIGPDLTHVGSRLSLAAGILPNDGDALMEWIGRAGSIKPDAHMLSFGMLPTDDVRSMAAYLEALQ
jgi:cytochrome c oxidase subunit II